MRANFKIIEMSNSEEQTQFVYLVTSDETGQVTTTESHGIQPQIVFTTDTIPSNSAAIQEPQRYIATTIQAVNSINDTSDATSDIWSRCNNALRDLLVFLVKKYQIEEVMDSKVKALQWDKLSNEFYTFLGGQAIVSKAQIVRKWHNWKQYNKAKKKVHPFDVVGELNMNLVREKCETLLRRVEADDYYIPVANQEDKPQLNEDFTFQPPLARYNKLQKRDLVIRRTNASASALSTKKLEFEVNVESLHLEQERWRLKCENQALIKEKLSKKLQLTDIRLDTAKLELELLKHKLNNS